MKKYKDIERLKDKYASAFSNGDFKAFMSMFKLGIKLELLTLLELVIFFSESGFVFLEIQLLEKSAQEKEKKK